MAYDAAGNLTDETSLAGQEITFAYAGAARLRTKLTYLNSVTANYNYDGGGRLTGIAHLGIATGGTRGPASVGVATDTIAYTHDAVGNISSRADHLGTHNYGYDNLYQVTGADYAANPPQQDESFAYDLVGNRATTTRGSTTTAYQSNNLNQYTQVGADPYSYDANGNLTNDGRLTLAYDTLNRLKQTVAPLEPPTKRGKGRIPVVRRFLTLDYTHDFMNRLMTRRETRTERGNATQTRYAYDGWSTIGEAEASTSLNRIYVMGPMVDEVLSQDDNGGRVYLLHDHLGSTVAATDDRGKIIERYVYDVFGSVTVTDDRGKVSVIGEPRVRSLFTGRWYEPVVKLYDYRNRWHSPGVGRFLQTDPIGMLSDENRYLYTNNRPINASDPFGLDLIFLNDQQGANNLGHSAVLVGDDKNGWTYYSFSGGGLPQRTPGILEVRHFPNLAQARTDAGLRYIDRFVRFSASRSQDLAAMRKAGWYGASGQPYDVTSSSCNNMTRDAFTAAGIPLPSALTPNATFNASVALSNPSGQW